MDDLLDQMKEELLDMEYKEKSNDLYNFSQTQELMDQGIFSITFTLPEFFSHSLTFYLR